MASLLLLSACGGGGGGGVNSIGTPPTRDSFGSGSTTTTSQPAPVVTTYDDAEYARSNGAKDAGAITAWNSGATGSGVTVAVVDTGLTDATGSEFAGRISSRSTSVSDGAGYADADGHGTAVAAVAAAAHNGSDVEGLAFGATVMALRADATGSCGTTDGCSFNTSALATAVDYATQNGAKVINMSLGGNAATSNLRAAIDRATSAGVIVVIAGGNGSTDQPDPLAQIAADPVAHGLVVIAGAHDSTGAASGFTGKAGDYGNYYISALGTGVRSFDNKGTDYLYDGTSFAAPAVSAAIALLEGAFPTLTPTQIVSLLYQSATDAGATGIDPVFGNGLLNIAAAFQPAGKTSLPGSQVPVSLTTNAVLSSAMGDASMTGSGLARSVILDGYGRAFAVDLTGTVTRLAAQRPLANAIAGQIFSRDQQVGPASVSLTLARDPVGEPWVGLAQRGLTGREDGLTRPIAASARMAFGRDTSAAFGFAQSGRRIGDLLDEEGATGSYLAARDPDDGPGFDGAGRLAVAVRHWLGRVAIDGMAEHATLTPLFGDTSRPTGYTMMTVKAGRRFGPLRLAGGVGLLQEEASVLGARFGTALGGRGSRTELALGQATLALGDGWRFGAEWRQGWTQVQAGGVLASGRLVSVASAFDFGRSGRAARFGLRLAQPLRVTSGGFGLETPVSYDYATGQVGYAASTLNLAPSGHERDVEASYGRRVAGGWLDANLYVRRDPGNIAALPDDRGAALRYQLAF